MQDKLVDLISRNRAYDMAQGRRQYQAAREERQWEQRKQEKALKEAEEAQKSWKNTLVSTLPGLLSAGAGLGMSFIPGMQVPGLMMMGGGLAGALGEGINTKTGGPFATGDLSALGTGLGSQIGQSYAQQQSPEYKLRESLVNDYLKRNAMSSPRGGLSAPMFQVPMPSDRFSVPQNQPYSASYFDPRSSQY